MNLFKRVPAFLVAGILAILLGCSQGGGPVAPGDTDDSSKSMPVVDLSLSDEHSSLGLMGAFELGVNQSDMSAELITKRMNTIGESYIVSGLGFFTVAPCSNCLSLAGIKFSGGKVGLQFKIRHPFDPGDPSQPPTARNRLDLDVFDLAMVVVPTVALPVNFPLTGVDAYANVVTNASGYTRELANLINKQSAMPYVLVVDNTKSPPPHTWNKFGMGAESFFDVFFNLTPGVSMKYDMYLTMGYGTSAKKPQRLDPKYYNPEFNRKAAWKVLVTPPDPCLDTQPIPSVVKIKVYDWQVGATVYGTPSDFASAPSNNIYAASEVESVSVEVPGMAPTLFTSSTPTGGIGLPDDPLIYEIPVINVNHLSEGTYTGIVKVTDERSPLTPTDGRDYLIDSPDGIALVNYTIPEYATYQTFKMPIIHEGLTIQQVNFEIHNSPDPIIIENSPVGTATVGLIGKADVNYFNLTVNGIWVVENVPLLSSAGDMVPQSVSFNFNLMTPVGMDVTELMVGWSVEPFPTPPPPPSGFIPVTDRDVFMKRGFLEEIEIYWPPLPLSAAPVLAIAVMNRHNNGLDCGEGECVPSAISNSLGWMQDSYGIPPSDKPTDIETMKGATGWTEEGWCDGTFPEQKDQYMQDNGYDINTETYPPGDPPNNVDPDNYVSGADIDNAMNAVNSGHDVEILFDGHCAAVTGIAKNADGSYTLTIAHDTDQGNDGGVAIETITYDPNDASPSVNGGTGVEGSHICGFVDESPW